MSTETMELLVDALLEGDQVLAVAVASGLREAGIDNESIIVGGIERAMELLDAKYTIDQFNLLEIML